MTGPTQPRIAALRYAPGDPVRDVLQTFAAQLKAQGLGVHGLLQEKLFGDAGACTGVDAIDLATNQRIALSRPTRYELDHKVCSLNLGQLAEATAVLRRALEQNADIVLVERFGKTERDGGGLADDLLALMASGTPTVVSVPQDEFEAWQRFSGGLGEALACDLVALATWWDGG